MLLSNFSNPVQLLKGVAYEIKIVYFMMTPFPDRLRLSDHVNDYKHIIIVSEQRLHLPAE